MTQAFPTPEVRLAGGTRTPLPDVLLPRAGDPAVLVLLNGSADPDWAARAAIRLAAAWATAGRRVVLADLHLEDPRLHDHLGEPNLDGVVDAFLYGASLARTARPASGHGFYLIPAGTYTADAAALYQHPRWPKIVAGFAEANASLLIFAPREAAILAERFGEGAQVVLLGGGVSLPEGHSPVRATVLPDEPDPSLTQELPLPPAGVPLDGVPLDVGVVPVGRGAELPERTEEVPVDPLPPRRRHRGVGPLLWVVLAAALLGAGALWLLGRRPELRSELGEARAADSLGLRPARLPTSRVRSAGVPLAYSVQVKAFSSLDAARAQAEAGRRRMAGVPFFVSPERLDGILYHRVLAGMFADSNRAGALRDRLVEEGLIDREEVAGSAWSLLRNAPLAFQLGELPARADADRLADTLLVQGVPAYVVAVPQSDGGERFRVYGGAFRDSASAEAMRAMLDSAGITPPLEPRLGAPDAPVSPAASGDTARP